MFFVCFGCCLVVPSRCCACILWFARWGVFGLPLLSGWRVLGGAVVLFSPRLWFWRTRLCALSFVSGLALCLGYVPVIFALRLLVLVGFFCVWCFFSCLFVIVSGFRAWLGGCPGFLVRCRYGAVYFFAFGCLFTFLAVINRLLPSLGFLGCFRLRSCDGVIALFTLFGFIRAVGFIFGGASPLFSELLVFGFLPLLRRASLGGLSLVGVSSLVVSFSLLASARCLCVARSWALVCWIHSLLRLGFSLLWVVAFFLL